MCSFLSFVLTALSLLLSLSARGVLGLPMEIQDHFLLCVFCVLGVGIRDAGDVGDVRDLKDVEDVEESGSDIRGSSVGSVAILSVVPVY